MSVWFTWTSFLNHIKNQEEGYGAFFLIAFSDLAGTLTQDLRNRNPTLYTTKLRGLSVFRGLP